MIPICRWWNSKSVRGRKKRKKNHHNWLFVVPFLHHLARHCICSWSAHCIHFRPWCSTLEYHQTPISLHSRLFVLRYHLFPRSLEFSAVPDLFQCKPWWLQGFWPLHKHICGQDWNWCHLLDVEAPTYCRSLYHRSQVCGSMWSRQKKLSGCANCCRR